jgi:hypothetical protein
MPTYRDVRRQAYKVVEDMEIELAKMERTYRRYEKHGAVNSAKALEREIDTLRRTIEFEEHLLGVAFD